MAMQPTMPERLTAPQSDALTAPRHNTGIVYFTRLHAFIQWASSLRRSHEQIAEDESIDRQIEATRRYLQVEKKTSQDRPDKRSNRDSTGERRAA